MAPCARALGLAPVEEAVAAVLRGAVALTAVAPTAVLRGAVALTAVVKPVAALLRVTLLNAVAVAQAMVAKPAAVVRRIAMVAQAAVLSVLVQAVVAEQRAGVARGGGSQAPPGRSMRATGVRRAESERAPH
jgi:hypothetical protein